MDQTQLRAYFGVLVLAGVFRSKGESAESLWDAETGREIFRATMSLENFHIISRIIRFDNRDDRPARRQRQTSCHHDSVGQVGAPPPPAVQPWAKCHH